MTKKIELLKSFLIWLSEKYHLVKLIDQKSMDENYPVQNWANQMNEFFGALLKHKVVTHVKGLKYLVFK